ncbi:MAG: N-acetylmuramoyl-L-alanine amidase [Solirubrobacteraceae bacterium]
MDQEQMSRRALLGLLGGAGAAALGRHGDALAAALHAGAASGAERERTEAIALQRAQDALAQEGDAAGSHPLPRAEPVLDAGPGQPPIIARRAWAWSDSPPASAPEYGTVQLAFVHHTDTPNGYSPPQVPAIIRSIYAYHRYTNGWNDIGYNFVVDRFGRIFEARAGGIDEPVIGAQAGGYNGFSTGIALLGTYAQARISPAARESLTRLVAWKLSLHGTPVHGELTVHCEAGGAVYSRFPAHAAVQLDRVSGHRQADATTCPGGALYRQLRDVRRVAGRLAGDPALLTLALEAERPASGAAPAQRTLGGSLRLLSGPPIAGATVEIQVRDDMHAGVDVQERTIATATTGRAGEFSVTVAVKPFAMRAAQRRVRGHAHHAAAPRPAALRALHSGSAGAPAAVSAPLELALELLPHG